MNRHTKWTSLFKKLRHLLLNTLSQKLKITIFVLKLDLYFDFTRSINVNFWPFQALKFKYLTFFWRESSNISKSFGSIKKIKQWFGAKIEKSDIFWRKNSKIKKIGAKIQIYDKFLARNSII